MNIECKEKSQNFINALNIINKYKEDEERIKKFIIILEGVLNG